MKLSDIKFRIWNGHKMVYGPTDDNPSPSWVLAAAPLFNSKVEQFVGLKDVNGKDIYTGDILKTSSDNQSDYIGEVKYQQSYCAFCNGDFALWDFGSKSEIIGNIYQNPELLK